MTVDPVVEKIARFFEAIGLAVRFAEIPGPTFLPGVAIRHGVLTIDPEKLLYPGDLFHEAGHLAVLPPADRVQADGDVGDDGGMEMAAIAWSYAAAAHLGLPADFVFHDAGYRGGAGSLRESFAAGYVVGLPMLEWMGLSADAKRAALLGVAPYPAMLRWLRS